MVRRTRKPTPSTLSWHRVVLIFFTAVCAEAWALTENHVPTAGDYIFYTFALSGVAFSAAVIAAYREYRWLLYVVFAVLLLANSASIDGVLAYFIGQHDFILWVVPYLLTATTAACGFFIVGLNLLPPHPLARYKRLFFALAFISVLFPLSCVFWLGNVSLALMWLPVNALFFTMVLAQALPPLTWQSSDRLLDLLTKAFPMVVGLLAVAVYLIHFISTGYSQAELNSMNRTLLLLFALFSITIVIWQAFASHGAKESAQRKALEAAKCEAQLQLDLIKAEQDYKDARTAASRHRSQLASVSHDLKQPISALRIAIGQLQRVENRPQADHLATALEYIDSLSRSWASEKLSGDEPEAKFSSVETVSTRLFAQTLEQMFAEEAACSAIRLDVRYTDYPVAVDPLSTMRIMTNLIGNALVHADATRLLVGFRRRGNHVVFQVHDNGRGMDEDTLSNALLPGVKGTDSGGQGLGLKIVQELCRAQQGMRFTMYSTPGRGTSALVEMPIRG